MVLTTRWGGQICSTESVWPQSQLSITPSWCFFQPLRSSMYPLTNFSDPITNSNFKPSLQANLFWCKVDLKIQYAPVPNYLLNESQTLGLSNRKMESKSKILTKCFQRSIGTALNKPFKPPIASWCPNYHQIHHVHMLQESQWRLSTRKHKTFQLDDMSIYIWTFWAP